ncbi:hypothetical protein ACFE04_008428 [Oxalis oulophora]
MEPLAKSPKHQTNVHDDDDDVDRFSSLPNHVAHHILSFLMIEDIARLSLVSKTYENLCLTVPKLAIEDTSKNGDECSPQRVRHLDYLVGFINRRNRAKLTDFFISWGITGLPFKETVRVDWLLNQAMLCKVNKVIIELHFDEFVFLVPLEVFWTQSLTSLSILLGNCHLEFPSPYGFSNLKHLLIDHAVIENDSLGEWISSVCKCLQKLWLTEISGMEKFKISSKSLQELEIVSCNLDYLDITAESLDTLNLIEAFDLSSSTSSLKVYAPNLLILDCSGYCIEYFTVNKSKSNYSVGLCLPKECPARTHELKTLLSSIVQATELTIDHFSLQQLFLNNCLPYAFSDLQSLRISHDCSHIVTIPAIAWFLLGLSQNLKKMHMYHDFSASDGIPLDINKSWFDLKVWESRKNLLFIHGVEEVELDIQVGVFEEWLVDFLLKNARKLKKLTISSKHSIPAKLAQKLVTFLAASPERAELTSSGNKMVVEFKPQLDSMTLLKN